MTRTLLWTLIAVLSLTVDANASGRKGEAGVFDYYVLALSWSPAFCADRRPGTENAQCGAGRAFGFIVHGLWPQYERGWPERCPTSHPLFVPSELISRQRDTTPSHTLVIHQWRKHGVCSGLSQQGYYGTTRDLFETLSIPPRFRTPDKAIGLSRADIVEAFVKDNPGLRENMMALRCDGRQLEEIRICFSRSGAFRRCGDDVLKRSCRRSPLLLLPLQGGT